jgi:4-hydroxybenzoate polyprenyltransferase
VTELPAQTTVVAACDVPRPTVADIVRLLRIPHWVKSAIVFPVVVLTGHAYDGGLWQRAVWAFVAFCLASSAVYALNDLFDRDLDRLHPLKRLRPVAAGRLVPRAVLAVALAVAAGSLALAAAAGVSVLLCVFLYLGLNLAYSLKLKHIPVVDACCVASGFALRALAVTGLPGGSVRSGLLLVSVFALCFHVAVSKRTADLDLVAGGPDPAGALRAADGYTRAGLRRLLLVSGVATLLSYASFAATVVPARVVALLSSLPVAYCLWRLRDLSAARARAEQFELIRTDTRLIVAGLAWAALWGWVVLF